MYCATGISHALVDVESNVPCAVGWQKICARLWHEEIYRLFGIATDTPLTLADIFALIHPGDRETVGAAWQAALDGAPYDIEHRIAVGGEVKWVHEQAELEFDLDGKARFTIGTVQKITERKLAEEKLRESYKELEKLTTHLEVVREEEQKRIARELHDEMGGVLAGLYITVSLLTSVRLNIE